MFVVQIATPAYHAIIIYHKDLKNIDPLSLIFKGFSFRLPNNTQCSYFSLSPRTIQPQPIASVSPPLLNSIPQSTPEDSSSLPCTIADTQKIKYLITTVAEKGKITLFREYKTKLEQIGQEIEHVHPLKFLGTILVDPDLKSCMKKIYNDYFKWGRFIKDLEKRLSLEAKQGKILPFLDNFAKIVGVSSESLKDYIDRNDWKNMVIFLINH